MLWVPVPVLADERPPAEPGDDGVPVLPARRPPDAPPEGPPALPASADRVAPLTLEVLVRRRPASGPPVVVRQTVTRTADRIHVAAGEGREWLLERNERDPRRASGFVIDHAERAIIEYGESDLRNHLGIRGWADAFMLGFDRSLLDSLRATGQARTLGGVRFVRYAPVGKAATMREAWWSDEQALASGFVTTEGEGSTRFTIERVRVGVDVDVLRRPSERLPTYRVLDLADWLDRE